MGIRADGQLWGNYRPMRRILDNHLRYFFDYVPTMYYGESFIREINNLRAKVMLDLSNT